RLTDGPAQTSLADLAALLQRTVGYQRNLPPVPVRVHPVSEPDRMVPMPQFAALQILLNLVANAKEASSPNALVEVAFLSRPDSVVIEVRDQGRGIPAEAGQALASSRDPVGHGGTGLFAARAMAERFGGGIESAGDQAGGGLVRVTLPLAARA